MKYCGGIELHLVKSLSHIILVFDDCNILIPVVDNLPVVRTINIEESRILYCVEIWNKKELIATIHRNENLYENSQVINDGLILQFRDA